MATPQGKVDLGEALAPSGAKYPSGWNRPDREYAEYVGALWDEQQGPMRHRRRVWTGNLMFLSGRHWWEQLPFGDRWQPIEMAPWKETPVTNLCLAFFRTLLAKATKNRPAWDVVPATMEPEDIHAAELGDVVLQSKWVELSLSRTLRRALAWCIATGNGFLYPYWNTDTGRIRRLEAEMEVPLYDEEGVQTGTEVLLVPLDEEGEPQLGEDGRPRKGAEPHVIDEGDVGVMAPSPYQVLTNPDARDENTVRWQLIAEVVTLREAAHRWPDKAAQMAARDVEDLENYDRLLSGAMSTRKGLLLSGSDDRDRELEKTLVFHFHERPTVDHPGGRYWLCTHDVLLEKPVPLPEGVWPPLVHLTDVEMPGSWWASSVLEQVVPLNRAYNENNAQILEHHNLMLKGKWLNPKPSGIRKGMITNQPGEVITYNPGFPPHQADIKPLPATVYQERDRILADYELVSGIHRVSMGRPPPGVIAGVAFLQLQEADDTDIGPFLTMLEEGVARLGRALLMIIQGRYHEERLVYSVGRNRRYLVRPFRGSELAGVADVVAQTGSAFPWSRTAQQSMLLTLAGQMPQLFTDPETGMFDTARFARLLPVGGLESVSEAEDIDVQEALREEEWFSQWGMGGVVPEGIPPEVGWWQRHDVHFSQHVRVLKSAAFSEWVEEARQAYLQHVQQTMQERDAKAQQAAQMNAVAQGNAPKEVYAQGGMMGGGGMNGDGGMMIPEEGMDPALLDQMAQEQMAGMAEQGLEGEDWVNQAMLPEGLGPPPAARGRFAPTTMPGYP